MIGRTGSSDGLNSHNLCTVQVTNLNQRISQNVRSTTLG